MKKAFVIFMLALLSMGMLLSGVKLPTANAASQSSINAAIQKGLTCLNSTQNKTDGAWSESLYPVASTAMAVLAFENAPNSHYGWNKTDPYNTTVQKGLNWLFSKASVIGISGNNSAGNPEGTNGNGIGIGWYWDGPLNSVYETSMVLMAIVASNAPKNVTTTGPANVIGRTYHDIAQDVVDWIAWAQNSNVTFHSVWEGGWRYYPQYYSSDNSVSQWPVIGLMAAELWNINAPPWVKTELLKWTAYDQDLTGTPANTNYGSFGYIGPDIIYGGVPDTAAGILELTYCNVTKTDPRIVAAEGYLNRVWNTNDGVWMDNIGCLYAMYALMKACREATPTPIAFISNYNGTPGVEWYNGTGEYADALIANQGTAHGWPNGAWKNWVGWFESPDISNDLGTAWGVLILEYVPVVVKYHLSVTVLDAVTSIPIVGATVSATGPETLSGMTGLGGRVDFNKTQAGNYNVTASKTGYTSASVPLSLTNDTEITIRLQRIPSVGGLSHPTADFGLWSLYLGLASILMFATVATAICTKRVKRGKEKQ